MPVTAGPATSAQVAEWVRATMPDGNRLFRFKWLFRDERSSAGGRGSLRIAMPDSVRFDAAGPLGAGAAAAMVVGDSAVWAKPEDALSKLVPNYPLMWAMFGVARMPDSGAVLRGLSANGTTAWQYVAGADTVEYARTGSASGRLVTIVRHAGELVGRAETTFGPDGAPIAARLVVPSAPARLDLTFTASSRPATFPSEIWAPPADAP